MYIETEELSAIWFLYLNGEQRRCTLVEILEFFALWLFHFVLRENGGDFREPGVHQNLLCLLTFADDVSTKGIQVNGVSPILRETEEKSFLRLSRYNT